MTLKKAIYQHDHSRNIQSKWCEGVSKAVVKGMKINFLVAIKFTLSRPCKLLVQETPRYFVMSMPLKVNSGFFPVFFSFLTN